MLLSRGNKFYPGQDLVPIYGLGNKMGIGIRDHSDCDAKVLVYSTEAYQTRGCLVAA